MHIPTSTARAAFQTSCSVSFWPMAGLGHLLPQEHVRAALLAIYRHNFRQPLGSHVTLQRTYALPEESGLVLCTWPRGGQPVQPFVYCDEVWTGVEYHVAAHLIYEGYVAEGLEVVRAARARYDGIRRNPWDEVECGHHYARSMASWALLPALSGFSCDVNQRILRFAPLDGGQPFRLPFFCAKAWGLVIQDARGDGPSEPRLTVLGGHLEGFTVDVGGRAWRVHDGRLHVLQDNEGGAAHVFPGNVGTEDTLAEVIDLLDATGDTASQGAIT